MSWLVSLLRTALRKSVGNDQCAVWAGVRLRKVMKEHLSRQARMASWVRVRCWTWLRVLRVRASSGRWLVVASHWEQWWVLAGEMGGKILQGWGDTMGHTLGGVFRSGVGCTLGGVHRCWIGGSVMSCWCRACGGPGGGSSVACCWEVVARRGVRQVDLPLVKYVVKIAESLEGWREEYGGPDALKSVCETCNGCNDLVLHRYCLDCWVLVLEESCAGDACGTSWGGSKLPTTVVFNGRAQNKCFGAVFSVDVTFMGLVVDQSFHANGDNGMTIAVVLFIDMRVRQ